MIVRIAAVLFLALIAVTAAYALTSPPVNLPINITGGGAGPQTSALLGYYSGGGNSSFTHRLPDFAIGYIYCDNTVTPVGTYPSYLAIAVVDGPPGAPGESAS